MAAEAAGVGDAMTRWLIAAVLLCIVTGNAGAQTPQPSPEITPVPGPSDAVKAMIGAWEFTTSGRDRLCTIRFRIEPAAHGMKLDLEPNCVTQFGFLGAVTGWTIAENDFLRLVDAEGRPVLEFSEVENGVYEAPKPGEGIMFIQKPATAPATQRSAADLAGGWVIARGNRVPICALTLSATPSGEDFALRVTPPCNALVTQFGPTAWRIDNDELLLKSARGQTWRFEETEDRVWRRVPASANPVLLLRK